MRAYLAIALLTSACSSNSSTPDAAPVITDVETVTCDATSKGPITTVGVSTAGMYDPSTLTIAVGDNVKFVTTSEHDVVPDLGGDVNLTVDFGQTKCLKFKKAAIYGFHCGPHGFKGTVTVQ